MHGVSLAKAPSARNRIFPAGRRGGLVRAAGALSRAVDLLEGDDVGHERANRRGLALERRSAVQIAPCADVVGEDANGRTVYFKISIVASG